ncbi:PAS domain-containing protein [Pararhizobium mangrovi]|nr:PAS domain-containing protein [Pararhizobium mangrovi]
MRHTASLHVFAYWNRLRAGRLAPDRHEIAPSELKSHLPHVFMATRPQDDAPLAFRLAGTAICGMMGRELRGSRVHALWSPDEHEAIDGALEGVLKTGRVAVLGLYGFSTLGRRAEFEMTAMPLAGEDGIERLFGTLVPLTRPYWLEIDTLTGFVTTALDTFAPDEDPPSATQVPSAGDTQRVDEVSPRAMAPSPRTTALSPRAIRRRRFGLIRGGRQDG